uniref:Cysteine-rich domain-containing protein n=1 Tax=Fundidesulfovibrio putealis TaxID=270496 RepID=A0A7C4EL27_9BACT
MSALSNPELSWPLGRSRAALAAATGASVVAAACPGCLLQLRGCLAEADVPARTAHPLELLANALPGE